MKFLKMEEIRRWISCWRRVQSFFFFVGGATNVNVEISWSQVWPNLQEDRVYSQTTRWGRLPRDMTYEADGLKSVLGLVFSPLEAIKGLKWRNKAVGDRFPPSWCALSFSPSQGKEECVHAHVRACVCVWEREREREMVGCGCGGGLLSSHSINSHSHSSNLSRSTEWKSYENPDMCTCYLENREAEAGAAC